MFSEIAFVCCALLALQASFGLSLPTGNKIEDLHLDPLQRHETDFHHNDEEEGYQVVSLRPDHSLKVEVVDEDGVATIRDLEIVSAEKQQEKAKTPQQLPQENKIRKNREDEKDESKCNWRRLYKLYVKKQRMSGKSEVNVKRKKAIRQAFKVVCENPEEVIRYLLDIQ